MEQPDERPAVNSEGIKQAGGKDERQETEAEVTWMSPNRLIQNRTVVPIHQENEKHGNNNQFTEIQYWTVIPSSTNHFLAHLVKTTFILQMSTFNTPYLGYHLTCL